MVSIQRGADLILIILFIEINYNHSQTTKLGTVNNN